MLELFVLYQLLGSAELGDEILFVSLWALVVVYSAIWVGLDLRALYRQEKVRGETVRSKSPMPWVLGFLLVWTVALPAYLVYKSRLATPAKQHGSRQSRDTAGRTSWRDVIWSLAYGLGAVTFAVVLATGVIDLFPRAISTAQPQDRVDLMLGVVTIALMILSLVAAGLALLGWRSLVIRAEEIAKQEVIELADSVRSRDQGWVHLIAGYIFKAVAMSQELSTGRGLKRDREAPAEPAEERPHLEEVATEEFLELAIVEATRALRKLSESGEKLPILKAQNNLAYYLALRGRDADADKALDLASAIYEEHRKSPNFDFLSTYCRVKMQFSEDWEELLRLRSQLERFRKLEEVPSQEHRKYFELYYRILKSREGEGNTTERLAERLRSLEQLASSSGTGAGTGEGRKGMWDALKRRIRDFF